MDWNPNFRVARCMDCVNGQPKWLKFCEMWHDIGRRYSLDLVIAKNAGKVWWAEFCFEWMQITNTNMRDDRLRVRYWNNFCVEWAYIGDEYRDYNLYMVFMSQLMEIVYELLILGVGIQDSAERFRFVSKEVFQPLQHTRS